MNEKLKTFYSQCPEKLVIDQTVMHWIDQAMNCFMQSTFIYSKNFHSWVSILGGGEI